MAICLLSQGGSSCNRLPIFSVLYTIISPPLPHLLPTDVVVEEGRKRRKKRPINSLSLCNVFLLDLFLLFCMCASPKHPPPPARYSWYIRTFSLDTTVVTHIERRQNTKKYKKNDSRLDTDPKHIFLKSLLKWVEMCWRISKSSRATIS